MSDDANCEGRNFPEKPISPKLLIIISREYKIKMYGLPCPNFSDCYFLSSKDWR